MSGSVAWRNRLQPGRLEAVGASRSCKPPRLGSSADASSRQPPRLDLLEDFLPRQPPRFDPVEESEVLQPGRIAGGGSYGSASPQAWRRLFAGRSGLIRSPDRAERPGQSRRDIGFWRLLMLLRPWIFKLISIPRRPRGWGLSLGAP